MSSRMAFIKNMSLSERKMIGMSGSTMINGAMGIFKLGMGLYYMSDWLIVNAWYYLVLCIAKVQLIKKYSKLITAGEKERRIQEKIIFQKNGKFQILIGLSYFFVSLHTILAKEIGVYHSYMKYAMAVIAFYKVGMAIREFYKMRKRYIPVVWAICAVNFTDAMVSMVVCRSVLQEINNPQFAIVSSGILGIMCSIVFCMIGFAMIKTKIPDEN